LTGSQQDTTNTTTNTIDSSKDEHHHDSDLEGTLSVMVLGSGGPAPTEAARASAGYLIFADQKPVVLMDAGGGSYARMLEAGVDVKDLDIILISHLHIDHIGALSAIVKSIFFQNRIAGTNRTAPFLFFGPDANGVPFPNTTISQYPSMSVYTHGLYDMDGGLERYLHVFSRAISGGEFHFEVHDLSIDMQASIQEVYSRDGLVIKSIAVNHGPVPAVGFRVEYKGKSIAYSGDTSSKSDNMIDLSMDTDLLIYDTAIMDDKPDGPNDGVFFALHTTPTRIGQVATAAHAKTLLLSHITRVTESRLDTVESLVKAQGYAGNIKQAEDLMLINLD